MFDLATAKTRLNITGTTQDVQLQAALDTALAWAETYCDRYFKYGPQEEIFTHTNGPTLSLKRYPIESINKGGPAHHFDADSGVVFLHDYNQKHQITVDYFGGYKTLPADLEMALWGTFDSVWSTMQSAGSAPVGGGAIKAISSDSQRIEYDTSGGAVVGVDSNSGLPSMAAAILNSYVRRKA